MHFIVPHAALFGVVIEQLVVIFVVGKPGHKILERKKAGNIQVLGAVLVNFGKGLFQRFFRVEDGRLVHIVPEPLNALVQQELVLAAKPGAGFGVEHIREMHPARPHTGHKGGAILIGAEVTVLHALFVYIVPVLNFNTRINDGHKADALGFHLGGKICKMGEALLVHRKVLVALHVVNIQHHGVQRHVVGAVVGHNLAHFVLVHVAPAALGGTKGPFGRDVAAPYQLAELVHNIGRAFTLNDVKIVIFFGHCHPQGVQIGVAAVKGDLAGIVDKKAKSGFAGHDHEVVSAVQ